MIPEFDPPPKDSESLGKENRFDGASQPRSHTQPSPHKRTSPSTGFRESSELGQSEAVRDVSIEALLYRLDEALAAIRSLDLEPVRGESLQSDELLSPDELLRPDDLRPDDLGPDDLRA